MIFQNLSNDLLGRFPQFCYFRDIEALRCTSKRMRDELLEIKIKAFVYSVSPDTADHAREIIVAHWSTLEKIDLRGGVYEQINAYTKRHKPLFSNEFASTLPINSKLQKYSSYGHVLPSSAFWSKVPNLKLIECCDVQYFYTDTFGYHFSTPENPLTQVEKIKLFTRQAGVGIGFDLAKIPNVKIIDVKNGDLYCSEDSEFDVKEYRQKWTYTNFHSHSQVPDPEPTHWQSFFERLAPSCKVKLELEIDCNERTNLWIGPYLDVFHHTSRFMSKSVEILLHNVRHINGLQNHINKLQQIVDDGLQLIITTDNLEMKLTGVVENDLVFETRTRF